MKVKKVQVTHRKLGCLRRKWPRQAGLSPRQGLRDSLLRKTREATALLLPAVQKEVNTCLFLLVQIWCEKRIHGNCLNHNLSSGFMPLSAASLPDHVQDLLAKLQEFMKENVYPNESVFEEHQKSQDCWQPHPLLETLKVDHSLQKSCLDL